LLIVIARAVRFGFKATIDDEVLRAHYQRR
jgi:hypothetical protein